MKAKPAKHAPVVRHTPENKSPLSGYYGGKAKIGSWILSEISHAAVRRGVGYIEPFAGGASVFFKIPRMYTKGLYVLNDTNGAVVNFYRHAKESRAELVNYAEARGLHSRQLFDYAVSLYHAGKDDLPTAWALWYLTKTSFAGILPKTEKGSFGLKKKPTEYCTPARYVNTGVLELDAIISRLEYATIECKPALEVIAHFDNPDNFLYVDPPYIQTNQGHYAGYTESDYAELLLALAKTKCRFALSGYDDELTRKSAAEFGWRRSEKSTLTSAGHNAPRKEVLTMNFPPAQGGML